MSKNILGLFDGSDLEGISALITQLEESSFDYLRLEGDGMKLVIGKNGVCETEAVRPVTAAIATPIAAPVPAAVPEVPAAVEPAPAVVAEPVKEDAGLFIVKSPSYGIFYSQPEPGAPSYVTLGATVKPGDTLGLLEIMKTFNAITAETGGEIVAIHAVNEQVLEPDVPLFSIKIK